jgi:hypothetical protein
MTKTKIRVHGMRTAEQRRYWRIMRLFAVTPIFVLTLVVGRAQEIMPLSTEQERMKPEAVQLTGFEWVVPELILGGEWTSSIKLTNRGTAPIPTTNVSFVDNNGNPMTATFQATNGSVVTGTGFSFTLGVGAVVQGTFLGGSKTQFGQAFVGCSANGCGTPGLYGEVVLRNHNSTRPDFESVFPFETPASVQYMLFDGANGYTTTMYLTNASIIPTTVAMDVMSTNNNLITTVNIPLSASGSTIFTLHAVAPQTIGILGTLVIRSPSSSVLLTATGLRVNPTNSFTPLRAFVPAP